MKTCNSAGRYITLWWISTFKLKIENWVINFYNTTNQINLCCVIKLDVTVPKKRNIIFFWPDDINFMFSCLKCLPPTLNGLPKLSDIRLRLHLSSDSVILFCSSSRFCCCSFSRAADSMIWVPFVEDLFLVIHFP